MTAGFFHFGERISMNSKRMPQAAGRLKFGDPAGPDAYPLGLGQRPEFFFEKSLTDEIIAAIIDLVV
jgi:hypothetical protein